jgi:signal transduction histidine kinase
MEKIRSFIFRLGVWPRLAIGVTAAFVILFVVFITLSELAFHESFDLILEERTVIAQMAAGEIDEFFHHVFTELTDAQNTADFDPADPDLVAEASSMRHIRRELGPLASSIVFVDDGGHVIISNPPNMYADGAVPDDMPYLDLILAADDYLISDPYLDPRTGSAVVAAGYPVWQDGRIAGFLIGTVVLSEDTIVNPLTRAAKLGKTGHATLFDAEGHTLSSTLNVPFLSDSEHPDFYQAFLAGDGDATGITPFALPHIEGETQDELHVMAAAKMRAMPWGVAVGGDEDDTFAGVRRLRSSLSVFAVIAFLGVGVSTLIGARALVHPMKQLTQAAQKIARGELDTPMLKPRFGFGEIHEMAVALEAMKNQLHDNISRLSELNENLESLVALQTKKIKEQHALTQELLHHTITVQEEERARIARELHDGVGQMIMAIEFSLDEVAHHLPAENGEGQKYLERSQALLQKTMGDVRQIIGNLRPSVLDQLGLLPAIKWVGKHVLQPSGIVLEIVQRGERPSRLPLTIETTLFRIAQEAINNVVRHSGATHLQVVLDVDDTAVRLELVDNGRGFEWTPAHNLENNSGFGLPGMQERAALAGGTMTVYSQPGSGTRISVHIPLGMNPVLLNDGETASSRWE